MSENPTTPFAPRYLKGQLHPEVKTAPPLSLPRFTFLCGSPGNGQQELALAMSKLDDDLCVDDLERPLRQATHELFFGGFDPEHDLTLEEERKKPLPIQNEDGEPTTDVLDWLLHLEELLDRKIGSGALGRIALQEFERVYGDGVTTFQRFLWRDATGRSDVQPFVNKFSATKVCLIHCGPLAPNGMAIPGTFNIWLPEISLDARMARIRKELES